MYRSHHETLSWLAEHKKELAELAQECSLVICAEATSLVLAAPICQKAGVCLGAQGCSVYQEGAHTGQISARSLQEIGVEACIIGHPEEQEVGTRSPTIIAQKATILMANGIVPIVCLGASALEEEIVYELEVIAQEITINTIPIIFAFEPASALGSGMPAPRETIEKISKLIHQTVQLLQPSLITKVIYGGSVNENSAKELADIPGVDGFLVGSASLDFQELKNIVLWNNWEKRIHRNA